MKTGRKHICFNSVYILDGFADIFNTKNNTLK